MGLKVLNQNGSWGLPDYGITEKISTALGYGTNSQGGGNIPNPGEILSGVQTASYNGPTPSSQVSGTTKNNYTSSTPYGPQPLIGPQKQTPSGQKSGGGQKQSSDPRAAFNNFVNSGGYAGWDMGSAWADWQATGGSKAGNQGGGGQGSEAEQINALYEPYLNELNNIAGGLNTRAMENLQNVEADYGQSEKVLTGEQADLEKSLALQGDQLIQGAQSGYSDALRAYNNLKQQGMNRFGGGSSTGAAISDLIGQQFLRTTGQARQQTANAQQQLGLEVQKVKTYIGQKKTDLDKWKRDASQMIRDNLASKLEEINLKRGEIESNKTAAKQDALRQAIADTRAIQQKDQEFKQGLATWALDTMQKTSGRSFTPQEIAQVYNDVIGQTYNGLNAYANAGTPTSYNQVNQIRTKEQEDKLRAAGLI